MDLKVEEGGGKLCFLWTSGLQHEREDLSLQRHGDGGRPCRLPQRNEFCGMLWTAVVGE